ncbi:MAG TPA: hypothetical protein VHW69_10150 [Rhizomicrobium sp.]|jgi:hypothetical protein|nr:hypothetical protein [Rhizomicrobium sp.]
MEKIWAGAAILLATTFAAPAYAQVPTSAASATAVAGLASGSEFVPSVVPGDEIVVACGPIEQREANSDVRVVLTIAAMPSDLPPGYNKVLATDEQVGRYGVKVRVPDMPDLPDHTVNLNVYVVGQNASHDCDGGHLRVVAHRTPDFRHELKSSPVS